MGLANAAGAKEQQVLSVQQPGGLTRQTLQLLPVAGFQMAVVKALKALLPGQMGAAQYYS